MIGRTIAGYEVLDALGAGGMGVVYKARHGRLQRLVALKLLPPDKAGDDGRRRRLLQEARAASALNHPGIVTIHDVVIDDGVDAIVMELIEGEPLDRRIPAGGMPWRQAAELAIELSEAVAAAHQAGIVHRDLKPANVVVTAGDRVATGRAAKGRLKVLDFGIARCSASAPSARHSAGAPPARHSAGAPPARHSAGAPPARHSAGAPLDRTGGSDQQPSALDTTVSKLSRVGVQPGTPAYMAPEQLLGEAVDRRADIFAFGVLVYEMLCGQRPFRGRNRVALADEVLHSDPPPIRQLRPDVPAAFATLVDKALAKQPAKRHQSMDEVRAELLSLLAPVAAESGEIAEGVTLKTLVASDLVEGPGLAEVTGGDSDRRADLGRQLHDLADRYRGREVPAEAGRLLLFDRPGTRCALPSRPTGWPRSRPGRPAPNARSGSGSTSARSPSAGRRRRPRIGGTVPATTANRAP